MSTMHLIGLTLGIWGATFMVANAGAILVLVTKPGQDPSIPLRKRARWGLFLTLETIFIIMFLVGIWLGRHT